MNFLMLGSAEKQSKIVEEGGNRQEGSGRGQQNWVSGGGDRWGW